MRWFVLALLLTACASSRPPASVPNDAVNSASIDGEVRIVYPPAGAHLYAEVVYVAGTASSLPQRRFVLRLVGPDDAVISSHTVEAPASGNWQVELLRGYSGAPIEVIIEAVSADKTDQQAYDAVTVMMASIQHRPASLTGGIQSSVSGASVGGDVIAVSGAFSGIPNNVFWLALTAADGRALDERQVALHNPYSVDLMPWSAELVTGGYVGPAELRAFTRTADGAERVLDSTTIVIVQEAG